MGERGANGPPANGELTQPVDTLEPLFPWWLSLFASGPKSVHFFVAGHWPSEGALSHPCLFWLGEGPIETEAWVLGFWARSPS